MELKNFQKHIITQVVDLLTNDPKNIILKSPVGSGKTVIASHIIQELSTLNEHFFVLWISVGKGNLHEQSFNAVRKYINLPCNLINYLFIQSNSVFSDHSINFINWESITKTNDDGIFTNTLMKDQEHNNLLDLINNSKKLGLKCLCFVDEAHIGAMKLNTNAYDVLNKVIQPDKIVYLSATPINVSDVNLIEVDVNEVIKEGLIKQSIIVNDFINYDFDDLNAQESSTFLLEQAVHKQQEIKKAYESIGLHVNPLVLIQVQNAKMGKKQIDFIIETLNKLNVTVQNEKLKIWLTSSTLSKQEQQELKQWDSQTSFLIFKTAIATGWDCPRACILVKFRESRSDVFDIQTIGRIYRSIDGFKHNNNLIDRGFIYTDIKNFDLKHLDYKFVQYGMTERKAGINPNLNLPSYVYKTIIKEKVLDPSFKKFLNEAFKKYENQLNLNVALGLNTLYSSTLQTNTLQTANFANTTKVKYDEIFIEQQLQQLIKMWTKNYLLCDDNSLLDYLLELVVNTVAHDVNLSAFILVNQDVFSKILAESINAYKKANHHIIENVQEVVFNLPQVKRYNTETTIRLDLQVYTKYVYNDAIFDKNINKLELAFMNMLEHNKDVYWYYRNDQIPSINSLNLVYYDEVSNKQRLFLPDFIVGFNDGTIGIFDTKANNDRSDIENYTQNTRAKNTALKAYLKSNHLLIGGMVVSSIVDEETNFYGDFKVFMGAEYKPYQVDNTDWVDFAKIGGYKYE